MCLFVLFSVIWIESRWCCDGEKNSQHFLVCRCILISFLVVRWMRSMSSTDRTFVRRWLGATAASSATWSSTRLSIICSSRSQRSKGRPTLKTVVFWPSSSSARASSNSVSEVSSAPSAQLSCYSSSTYSRLSSLFVWLALGQLWSWYSTSGQLRHHVLFLVRVEKIGLTCRRERKMGALCVGGETTVERGYLQPSNKGSTAASILLYPLACSLNR